MLEAEMDEYFWYGKSERSNNDDYPKGYKRKCVDSSYGCTKIDVSQDRKLTFKPQVVKKWEKEVLPLRVGDNKSAKYWYFVLTDLSE